MNCTGSGHISLEKKKIYLISQNIIASEIKAIMPNATVSIGNSGGDVDTRHIYVEVPECNDDSISICGFVTDHKVLDKAMRKYCSNRPNTMSYEESVEWCKKNPTPAENCEIQMVELQNNNSDCEGGIQSENEALVVAAARIRNLLKNKGFGISNNLNDYF